MDEVQAVSTIARQIQLSVAPVFLLAGIGAILNVLAHRLARVVDRARFLDVEIEAMSEAGRGRATDELKTLDRRMAAANWAISCCTASALFVCLVVAILFVAGLADQPAGRAIAWLFIAAMALLTAGLVFFLHEIRLATRSIRVRRELLDG